MADLDLAGLKRAAGEAARAGRQAEALDLFVRLAAVEPGLWWAPYNAGLLLRQFGREAEAAALLADAVRLAPERAEPHADLGLALLALGREAEGWAEFLWRPEAPRAAADRPRSPLPGDLNGRRFAVLNEQGLGDALFYLRYAAVLRDRGARVVHDPYPKLAALLRGVPWLEPVSHPLPDERIPLGDLPFLTGAPPPPALALAPRADAVAAVDRHLARVGPGPYLGVTWHAGVAAGGKLVKDAPPEPLGGALRGWPGTVIVLQRLPPPGSAATFRAGLGRNPVDLSALSERLEGMLALLDRLDAYVAVSNTNVHLRAGLGRPSHVLVPWPAEFRWPAGRARSPWFPDCPLFRQAADGDWAPALAALAAAITPGGA